MHSPTHQSAVAQPRSSTDEPPSLWTMLGEAMDLGAGFTVALLPFIVTAVPGLALFFVIPAVAIGLIGAVVALVGAAVLAPPVLLVRALRRRRAQEA